MARLWPICKREFLAYFRSPVAYVFIIIFLLSGVGSTFFLGGFFDGNQANLSAFFDYVPWLYLILVPAVAMRLWAEERRSGTVELLLTLPITATDAILAKFLAGWAFLGIALGLTFPLIITVNYLGSPDNGVIFAAYLGSFLMAGSYLAIGCFTSALSKNQVIGLILCVVICFLLVLLGWDVFTDLMAAYLPTRLIEIITSFGVIPHYANVSRGLIDSRDLLYFVSVIVIALALNSFVLSHRKAT